MYSAYPSVIYGFHGLDKEIAYKILNHEDQFHHSQNEYDWLGSGIYFWENNLERAKQYALQDSKRLNTKIKRPFVLGAALELGNCLDLLDQRYNDYLNESYKLLKADMEAEGKEMPLNTGFGPEDFDFKNRKLDCAVISYACALAEDAGNPFDSVRASFIEGAALYPGARFYSENHIQIAVINNNCIKGIFLPIE